MEVGQSICGICTDGVCTSTEADCNNAHDGVVAADSVILDLDNGNNGVAAGCKRTAEKREHGILCRGYVDTMNRCFSNRISVDEIMQTHSIDVVATKVTDRDFGGDIDIGDITHSVISGRPRNTGIGCRDTNQANLN